MWKKQVSLGALLAALAVIIGAFAAHGLKSHLESGEIDLQSLQNFETGARYQMYHAFAILFCGLLAKVAGENKFLKISVLLFTIGILFFSGSLYLMSTSKIIGLSTISWLGPVTPLGGLCFISGWVLLALGALKKNAEE